MTLRPGAIERALKTDIELDLATPAAPAEVRPAGATVVLNGGVAGSTRGAQVSDFLDKAEDMAEGLKDKVEDMIPDSVKKKLHIAGDADDAESTAVDAEDMAEGLKDKVEDMIPGDKDGDGH